MTEYANGKYWPSAGRRCVNCNRVIAVGEKAERRVLDGDVRCMHVGECPDMPVTFSDITDEMRRHPNYCCDGCEASRQELLRQHEGRREERLRDTTEWLAAVLEARPQDTEWSDPF